MTKNSNPSPSGRPRVTVGLRIDPALKEWAAIEGIDLAPFLEAALMAERRLRGGKGFSKPKK